MSKDMSIIYTHPENVIRKQHFAYQVRGLCVTAYRIQGQLCQS
jgi:hypothetical protein